MTLISAKNRILCRGIAIVYLLLFIIALSCSTYYLRDVIALKPIPLIALLKYILLGVLFVILAYNALKAISLYPQHLLKLYRGTTNFKWLFLIATGISLLAKLGLFNTAVLKGTAVTNLQIGILLRWRYSVSGVMRCWIKMWSNKKGQLK